MSMLKLTFAALLIIGSFVPVARAELLQAVRAGVMCVSADALAKLSLPDGSSRTAAPNPPAALQAIADAGGCTDFPAGHVVILITARKNTSIVRSDNLAGEGVMATELIPNMDFKPYSPPRDAFNDVIRARCPDRLELLAARGPNTYPFVQSLPAPTRSAIENAVDSQCGGMPRCTSVEMPAELNRRRLVQRWAEFVCAHPD